MRLDPVLCTRQINEWPSADTLLTLVGGLRLHLDGRSDTTRPDSIGNGTNLFGSPAASGGGQSAVFVRRAYQNSVQM